MAYGILGCSRGVFILLIERKIVSLVIKQQVLWLEDIRLLRNRENLTEACKIHHHGHGWRHDHYFNVLCVVCIDQR